MKNINKSFICFFFFFLNCNQIWKLELLWASSQTEYPILQMDLNGKKCLLDYLILASSNTTYIPYPHLHLILNLPIIFHQIPLSSIWDVALTRFCHVKSLIWTISQWNPPPVTIFFNAHLHMILKLPIQFHQHPLSNLGWDVLMRL